MEESNSSISRVMTLIRHAVDEYRERHPSAPRGAPLPTSTTRNSEDGPRTPLRPSLEQAVRELVGPTVQRTVGEMVSQLRAELRALLSLGKRQGKVLLSLREAARRLGVDRNSTLRELIQNGRLRVVSANGKLRVPATEVERLALEGFDSSPSPARRFRAARTRVEGNPGDAIRKLKL
jgi:excisionase family DNA binding protein